MPDTSTTTLERTTRSVVETVLHTAMEPLTAGQVYTRTDQCHEFVTIGDYPRLHVDRRAAVDAVLAALTADGDVYECPPAGPRGAVAYAMAGRPVPMPYRRGIFTVAAMRLTPQTLSFVWEWADSKPYYGNATGGGVHVTGLTVFTPTGRVKAEFGDWVVCNRSGSFRVVDDASFTANYQPVGGTTK